MTAFKNWVSHPENRRKEYVRHSLLKHKKEVYDWIRNKEAVVYVCGNKRTMGQDVKACLEEIISSEGGLSAEESAAYLQQLKSENRYQTDLY